VRRPCAFSSTAQNTHIVGALVSDFRRGKNPPTEDLTLLSKEQISGLANAVEGRVRPSLGALGMGSNAGLWRPVYLMPKQLLVHLDPVVALARSQKIQSIPQIL
jgi:hypothetical protein